MMFQTAITRAAFHCLYQLITSFSSPETGAERTLSSAYKDELSCCFVTCGFYLCRIIHKTLLIQKSLNFSFRTYTTLLKHINKNTPDFTPSLAAYFFNLKDRKRMTADCLTSDRRSVIDCSLICR